MLEVPEGTDEPKEETKLLYGIERAVNEIENVKLLGYRGTEYEYEYET